MGLGQNRKRWQAEGTVEKGEFAGKIMVEGMGTLGGALAVRLTGVPPAGSLPLLLVSWSRSGPTQTEDKIL